MRADDDREQSEVPGPGATKGLRIATRCVTVEQFVETYHQICEDSAIFIPNTRRPVKTVMQFRFDLHDGNPALLGIGTVVEELTTKHNRFDHVGVVVELQRLSRTSAITFDQMLAARARTQLQAPAPVYPRAMTVPIEVVGASKSEPHQVLRQVPIPRPTAVPSSPSPTRTKPVIGLPTLAKKPTDTVRIPAIIAPTRKQSFAFPPERPTPITVQSAERAPLEPTRPVLTPCVPSSIDDGWDSIASKIDDAESKPAPHARNDALGDAQPVVVAVTAATTTASIVVEDSLDVSDASLTAVADVDLASAPVDQAVAVRLEDYASAGTPAVTAIDRLVACAAEPDPDLDPFDTVTAVEDPDKFLLALMRRGDGRAAPAIIEAAVGPSPQATLAISEPMQPIVEDRLTPAVIERTFAPPTIAPATFPLIDAPFAPIDVPAIDHAALAGSVRAARRPWRWLAAAGVFAVLLCATAAATVFVDRPTASVPPSSTFVPAQESPLDSSAVATARDQLPTVAAPPAVAKSKLRARPSSVERPSPRPQPGSRPLGRPAAPKKCRDLGCL